MLFRSVWGSNWLNFWLLFNAVDVIDAADAIHLINVNPIVSCASRFAWDGDISFGNLMNCISGIVLGGFEDAESAAKAVGNAAEADKYATFIDGFNLLTAGLAFDNLETSYLTEVHAALQGNKHVTVNFSPPPVNVGSNGTGSTGMKSLAPDNYYIARTSDGTGYLVYPDLGTADEITSPTDFLCYAKTRYVWDYVPVYTQGDSDYLDISDLSAWIQITGNPAPQCPMPTGPTWFSDFRPASLGGDIPDNVLLHEKELDAGSNPVASWLINNKDEIQTIQDPGVYVCLALYNPVIWEVPYSDVAGWTPVGTASASCGPDGSTSGSGSGAG